MTTEDISAVSRFYKNIFSNAGASALNSAVQLLLILLLARWLSVEGFAIFLTATAVSAVGEIASDFGTRIWATKRFAVSSQPRQIFIYSVMAKALFSTVFLVMVLAVPLKMLDLTQTLLAVGIAATQPQSDPLIWYLRGKERLDIEAVIVISWKIASALIIAALAFWDFGISVLLSAWLTANIIRGLSEWQLDFLTPLKRGRAAFCMEELWQRVICEAFPIGLAFLLMALYQRLGVLLLGEISNSNTVALYGAAFTLVASSGFMATSITVSSFAPLVKKIAQGDWDQTKRVIVRNLNLIMMVFLPACIVGGLIAPFAIWTVYPSHYLRAAMVVFALLPGLYISTINFGLKYSLNALGLNWIDTLSAACGIVIFSAMLIVPEWSSLLEVSGWAWGAGELSIFLIKWFAISRDGRIKIRLWHHAAIFMSLSLLSLMLGGRYYEWIVHQGVLGG